MSSSPTQHPADRFLIAFDSGKLDDSQAAAVNKHLKNCPTCRRRLVKFSGKADVPSLPQGNRTPAVGVEALAAAVESDLQERRTSLPNQSPRWAKFVWPLAAVVAVLLCLVIAWGVGAFQVKTSVPLAAVEKRQLPIQPQPPKVTDQPPPARSDETQPLMPIPSPPAASKEEPSISREPSKSASHSVVADNASGQTPPQTEKPAGNASKPSPEFFNGKDLADWQGASDLWHGEKGSITGTLPAGQKQSAFLSSRQKYNDFDLRFVASLEEGIGDCGVLFRSQLVDAEKFVVAGPQCAIYGKDAPKDHRTGSLVTEPPSKLEKKALPKLVEHFVKPTTNHFRIRCQGKHVLIEVNGIKLVNGDFPSLPDEGVIAWKIDARRPPHKVTFTITKFTDLTGLPSKNGPERPSLVNAELLKAEIKFERGVKNADETLLKHFDPEINKRMKSSHAADKEFVSVVEHEKEVFEKKGLIPWSQPMRKALLLYGKELRDARRAVGSAFDTAIERADKSHNEKLKAALLDEAGQILSPRQVAIWQFTGRQGRTFRLIFFSDATYVNGDQLNQETATSSQFWAPPDDENIVRIERPDPEDPTATLQQAFFLSRDGKTLTTTAKNGQKQIWQRVED
jgi:hypothetical protein